MIEEKVINLLLVSVTWAVGIWVAIGIVINAFALRSELKANRERPAWPLFVIGIIFWPLLLVAWRLSYDE